MKSDPLQDTGFYIVGWLFVIIFAVTMGVIRICNIDMLHMFPPCGVYLFTGYYCPGCGCTRALSALMHGKIGLSFYYHPFILYTAAAGGWFMLSQTIERISRHRIPIGMHYHNRYMWIAVILIFVNMLIKNAVLYITGIPLLDLF